MPALLKLPAAWPHPRQRCRPTAVHVGPASTWPEACVRTLSRALSLCRYLALSVPSRSFYSHTHTARALSLSRSASTATSGTIATLPCACQRVAPPPCQSVTTKWNRQAAQRRMAHLWRLSNFSRASCPLLRFAKPNCALTSGRPRPARLTDATLSARRPASGCELAPRRFGAYEPEFHSARTVHITHEIALVRSAR